MTLTALPTALRWAVWLLTVEAIAVGLAAVFLVYQGIADDAANLGDAVALAGFAAVAAAALGGLAAGLRRRKPRARAPAIVLQLLTVMLAYALVTEGVFWLGLPAGLLGVATVTLLLAPSTTATLGR